MEDERREALRALPWVFVSLFGVAAGIAIVYLVMRAAMRVGGSCASGGPYVSARPCPDGTWLMPVGLLVGLIMAFVYALKKPVRAPSFASLIWPALFLSLGWNFLEFGLSPPGRAGLEWGWLVCAVVFVLIGGLPLLLALIGGDGGYLRRVFWGVTHPLIAPPTTPAAPGSAASAPPAATPSAPPPLPKPKAAPAKPASSAKPPDDVVASLERLAKLHRSGSLTDDEFEAAKRRVLEGGRRP